MGETVYRWRECVTARGLCSLRVSLPIASLAADAVASWVLDPRPSTLLPARFERQGDELCIETFPLLSPCAAMPGPGSPGTGEQANFGPGGALPAAGVEVRGVTGLRRWLPSPESLLDGSRGPVLEVVSGVTAYPPRFRCSGAVAELRAVLGRARLGAVSGPRLIVIRGQRGSGRSRLIDLFALDAALSGACVLREIPRDLGRSEAPLVLLLDDLERLPETEVERVAALAESASRPLLMVAAASLPGDVLPSTSALSLDTVDIPGWSDSELQGLLEVPAGGESPSPSAAMRMAATRAGGNPGLYRLWRRLLDASPRAERETAPAGASKQVLASLSASAQRLAWVLATEELAPAQVEQAIGGDAPWEDIGEWLEEQRHGTVRLLPHFAEAAAAFPVMDVRALRLGIAEALGREPGQAFRRGLHLALAGASEAASVAVGEAVTAAVSPAHALAGLAQLCCVGLEDWLLPRQLRLCLLERTGRIPEAMAEIRALLEGSREETRRAEFRVRHAALLARAGELALAEAELAAVAVGSPELEARKSFVRGFVRYRRGDIEQAQKDYELGLVNCGEREELRAEGLSGLGYVLVREPGGSRRGERLLAEAREIYSRLGSAGDLSRVLSREGSALARRGELSAAAARHREALEAALRAGDRAGVAECHVDAASVAFDQGDLRESERHLIEAERIFAAARDPRASTLVGANLAALAIELGRPAEAEAPLRLALERDRRSGARWHEAHDLRFLGLADLACGEVERAAQRLAEAGAMFRELGDEEGQAEVQLGLAQLAVDRGNYRQASAEAEAGLRTLSPRSGEVLSIRLALVAARARLELSADGLGARPVHSAIQAAGQCPDASVRAEGAQVELVAALASGQDLPSRLERAIDLGERQQRPDILARTLTIAVSRAAGVIGSGRSAALLERLRELHCGPGRRRRLELLGVRAALAPAPRPDALADDSLLRLDGALETGPEERARLMLALLGERVPFLRAALLRSDPDCGLRISAWASCLDPGSEPPGGVPLALLLGERARLIGEPVLLADAEFVASEALADVQTWGVGAAAAISAAGGTVLYLDRARAGGNFAPAELAFARALVRQAAGSFMVLAPVTPRLPGQERDDLGLIGSSQAMSQLRREIVELAGHDIPVFLQGESGTGKELAARALHRLSRRAARPLVAINCAALPEGLLESELFGSVRGAYTGAHGDREGHLSRADRGILLLDEVGELSPAVQAKLLRVVELGEFHPLGSSQLRRVDVRFLAATNRDVLGEVRAGRFREDLYYRLFSTATIQLPPLRERRGDIALLVSHFSRREAERQGSEPLRFSAAALRRLEDHSFPGNVRELDRLVAGLAARAGGKRVELADVERALGPRIERPPRGGAGTLADERDRAERGYLEALLERHGGNRTRAAREGGIARQTLIALIRKHRIGAALPALPPGHEAGGKTGLVQER